MDYGFIRVAVGDAGATGCGLQIQHEQLIAMLRAAADDGVRLIGFPELCITAYTRATFFAKSVTGCGGALLLEIAAESRGLGIVAVVGLPMRRGHQLITVPRCFMKGKSSGRPGSSICRTMGNFTKTPFPARRG